MRLLGTILLVVAAIAVVAAGWSVRDVSLGNANLEATWNGFLALLAGAFPYVAGALVGAFGAYIVAHENRKEARDARFADNKLALATDVIVQSDVHVRELGQSVVSVIEWIVGDSNGPVPPIQTTEPVRRAYVALDLLDHELGRKGEAIYNAIISLDVQTELLRTQPSDRTLADWDNTEYGHLMTTFQEAMSDFTDFWRKSQP